MLFTIALNSLLAPVKSSAQIVTPSPLILSWDNARQGAFVTCLAQEDRDRVLVGTEDNGVWRFNPKSGAWTR